MHKATTACISSHFINILRQQFCPPDTLDDATHRALTCCAHTPPLVFVTHLEHDRGGERQSSSGLDGSDVSNMSRRSPCFIKLATGRYVVCETACCSVRPPRKPRILTKRPPPMQDFGHAFSCQYPALARLSGCFIGHLECLQHHACQSRLLPSG